MKINAWKCCLHDMRKGDAIFATKSISILLQKHRLNKYQISLDLFTAPSKIILINMCTYIFLRVEGLYTTVYGTIILLIKTTEATLWIN